MTIKQQYEDAINRYIVEFCKKQDMEFNGWVAGEVGEICEINDFCFIFHDVKRDIDQNVEKGLIIDWYYGCVESGGEINYRTWLKAKKI